MTTRQTPLTARRVHDTPRATDGLSPISTAILIGIVGIAVLLTFPQLTGTGQWSLGLLVVASLAVFVAYEVSRRTKRPEPLETHSSARESVAGELASLSGLVDRANRGLSFSQDVLLSRIRGALLERIRLRRGLPPESVADLETNSGAIRDFVEDPSLLEFLLATQDREARARWLAEAQKDGGPAPALLRILERAEA